jgi:hypothetical protein
MSKLIFPTHHTYIRYEADIDFPDAWNKNFIWKDRVDYLEWVADWKTCLKAKIAAIQEEKAIRRDKSRDTSVRNGANQERQQLRIDCFNLLVIRRMGKRCAGEQRAAQRNLAA